MNKVIDAIHTIIAFWAMSAPLIIPRNLYPVVLLSYIFILGNWGDNSIDGQCHLTRLSDRFYKSKQLENMLFKIKETKNVNAAEQEKFIKRMLNDYLLFNFTDFEINEATFWIVFCNALYVFFKLHPDWTNGNLSPKFVLIFFGCTYLLSRINIKYFNKFANVIKLLN
jgi:hypothetical protein